MATEDLLRKRQRELGGETVYLVYDGSPQWSASSHGTADSIAVSIAVFAEAVKTFHANNHVYLVAYSPQTGRPHLQNTIPPRIAAKAGGDARIEPLFDCALLHCNKAKRALPSRIVVLTATPIGSFVVGMNGAFAAQKMDIVVDVIDATTRGSPELVQLTELTKGIYLRPRQLIDDLMLLVPDARTRTLLSPPPRPPVDLRAECFCHRKPVALGFVCSVCLAVYCDKQGVCPSCKVKVMNV